MEEKSCTKAGYGRISNLTVLPILLSSVMLSVYLAIATLPSSALQSDNICSAGEKIGEYETDKLKVSCIDYRKKI